MGKDQNKIENLISNAIKNLNGLVDVNTIIGKPFITEMGSIFPISKVTMGFLTGGGEYGDVKYFKKDENYPFSGGSGAVVSLNPVGFLIETDSGYKLIPIKNDMYDKLLNACENIIDSFTGKND